MKGFFRAGVMEGECEMLKSGLDKDQVDAIFKAAMNQNPNYISFNKANEERCLQNILKTVANKNVFPDALSKE